MKVYWCFPLTWVFLCVLLHLSVSLLLDYQKRKGHPGPKIDKTDEFFIDSHCLSGGGCAVCLWRAAGSDFQHVNMLMSVWCIQSRGVFGHLSSVPLSFRLCLSVCSILSVRLFSVGLSVYLFDCVYSSVYVSFLPSVCGYNLSLEISIYSFICLVWETHLLEEWSLHSPSLGLNETEAETTRVGVRVRELRNFFSQWTGACNACWSCCVMSTRLEPPVLVSVIEEKPCIVRDWFSARFLCCACPLRVRLVAEHSANYLDTSLIQWKSAIRSSGFKVYPAK